VNEKELRALLDGVRSGETAPEAAVGALRDWPFQELGWAKLDHQRALRQGFPEVILASSKTPAQVAELVAALHSHGAPVLATRATPAHFAAVQAQVAAARYHEAARLIHIAGPEPPQLGGPVGVLGAGTGDLPVAEEAAITLEVMGAQVERVHDVGVAGLHRLLAFRSTLRRCRVLIVVAGMEGALPSVVAGLSEAPVIAVPTSVGYGASFGGLAALLAMLNSCANGVAVVNIDNGFGAAAFTAALLRQSTAEDAESAESS
jgi:NCAIR mutase (PurE)-related protein